MSHVFAFCICWLIPLFTLCLTFCTEWFDTDKEKPRNLLDAIVASRDRFITPNTWLMSLESRGLDRPPQRGAQLREVSGQWKLAGDVPSIGILKESHPDGDSS